MNKTTLIRISKEYHQILKIKAASEGRTMYQILCEMCHRFLDDNKEKDIITNNEHPAED